MKKSELRYIIREEAKKDLNENIIVNILIKSMAWAGGAVVSAFLNMFIGRVINGAIRTYQDIKNIVAPEPYIKFLKRLEKNDAFNKQFIEFVIQNRKGDNLVGYHWIKKMTTLPAFVKEFDTFTTKEGIDEMDKSELLSKISKSMWQTYLHNWEGIYAILKKKYPQLANELPEGKLNKTPMVNLIQSEALVVSGGEPEAGIEEAKHTKGSIYKGKLKIGGAPVPVEVEMVGADNRTRSYMVRVIHIDRQYWSKLPKDGIIPIPSRLFDVPGGGWAKIKTPSVFEDAFPGGMADKYSLNDLAKKHGIGVDEIKSQIAKGVKVEMEHTDDKKVAFEIAKDHIFEDPKYYDKLKTIENMVIELLKKRISEDWTNSYKKSIDCNNPKGFSQKAHCAGRKARQRGEDTKSSPVK